jgi:UDP-N-acetylmuramate-alanine ligase
LSSPDWFHYVGLAGSGMSALAVFHAGGGGRATGSDRALDRGEHPEIRAGLARAGVTVVPQDGSGLAPDCTAVVVSTAIEDSVPDIRRARELGLPILHRSEMLARYVAAHRTIAVTGTSGKSTVTAMIFTLLRGGGRDPSLLTGGALVDLQRDGHLGNAWASGAGASDWLVIEADESDGSVVRYHPWAGVVLNLGRDHKEPAEVAAMFATFKANLAGPLILGEDANLEPLREGAVTFGVGPGADLRAEGLVAGPLGSRFTVEGVDFTVPTPGRHDALNALAALAAGRAAGLTLVEMAPALAAFGGVARRFQSLGTAGGVEVIDDFAHNPDKLSAALATAHARAGDGRVLAVFQPHGYGPTRFLWDHLVATFAAQLRADDVLWLPEIFYAGGSAVRDIGSDGLAAAIVREGRDARHVADRATLPAAIGAEARPGDLVLVMGARDPSLTDLGAAILRALPGPCPAGP